MGGAASVPGGVPSDLDVLHPSRPLHALLSSASPPPDPDADFWAALFRDYVVFHAAARPSHRAALRTLCASAAHAPRSPAARALALSLHAALPRARDYARGASSHTSREALGALLLAAALLRALADAAPVPRVCLALGAHAAGALRDDDRADIGRSALAHVLALALDCVAAARADDPLAPSVTLAAVNLALVGAGTRYLAPREGGGERALADVLDAHPAAPRLVCALFDLARDAAPHRDAAVWRAAVSPASSRAEEDGIMSSVSRRLSGVFLPGAREAAPAPVAQAAVVGEGGAPGGTTAPPPTPSGSLLVGDTEDGASVSTSGEGLGRSASGACVIARAPTLLGEQALALLAVLCAPRGAGNPYRAALLAMCDFGGRDDACVYPFGRLYQTLGAWVEDARGALLTYYLVAGNRRFRAFVLSRTDPDVLLVPLLAALNSRCTTALPGASADLYMPAIILLILTSDSGFCAAIDEILLPPAALQWYEDRARLGQQPVSLSGMVVLVAARCLQHSIMVKRRVLESFLASLCSAILGNVSSSITGINNHVADRLVGLVDFVGKRRRRSGVVAAHSRQLPVSPPRVHGPTSPRITRKHIESSADHTGATSDARLNGNGSVLDGAAVHEEGGAGVGSNGHAGGEPALLVLQQSPSDPSVAFPLSGAEGTEDKVTQTLTDILGTVLEVVASILRSRSNVSVNRHLMYSLMHREAIFDADYVEGVNSKTRALAGCIRGVISFFSSHLGDTGSYGGSPSTYGGNSSTSSGSTAGALGVLGGGGRLTDRLSFSFSSAGITSGQVEQAPAALSPQGISVDRVFEVIDMFARMLPRETLLMLPELRYSYCEADLPEEFVLPYSWVLAMRGSPLAWDPAEYPDAPIPLVNSVFHPPRPPHGSSGVKEFS